MANLIFYSGPAFLVAVGFLDPGKWATLIEGGSRFGYELLWVVVFSTILAMLLQSISARLGVITGKHLAQVFREEYPWAVCVLLWVFCEVSIVTLDLTMVLGTAVGLNVVLEMPMLLSLLLMTLDSLLFILILPLMGKERSEGATIVVMGIVLLCFLSESIFTRPLPLSMGKGLWPKLRHETLYTMISIVGANIMPHNFYLHSVCGKGQDNQSLSTLSHYNFLGTLFAFSTVLVVNLTVLIMAVSGFHNTGLVVLTLQDVQFLMDQIINDSISPAVFGLALLCVGHLSTFNGSTAGQLVLETLLDCKIRPWQHWVWIRILAFVPAVICVWRYGNEGTYQMLIFSQVLLALHLPFTIAPLIKITSSERIMGSHKNSVLLETSTWLSVIVISAVNVTLAFDLVFGDGEDGGSFRSLEYLAGFEWFVEMGRENFQTIVFVTISFGTSLWLGFLIWLIFTPLQVDSQLPVRSLWMEDYLRKEEAGVLRKTLNPGMLDDALLLKLTGKSEGTEGTLLEDKSLIMTPYINALLLLEATDKVEDNSSRLPFKRQEATGLLQLDNRQNIYSQDPPSSPGSSSRVGSLLGPCHNLTTGGSSLKRPNEKTSVTEDQEIVVLKEAETDADAECLGKEDDEYDPWESLEKDGVVVDASVSIVNGSTSSLQCEDHESGRSGRSDNSLGSEGESGSGSLSKLSGLGRAARRQFAFILDEFWANLFDLHGAPLSSDFQVNMPASRSCPVNGTLFEKCSSLEERDGQMSLSKPKPSLQVHNMDAYVLHMHTRTVASNSSKLSNVGCQEYGPSSSHRHERRYSSMQLPSFHENFDYQPATIHGYQTSSFPERLPGTCAGLKSRPLHMDVSLKKSGLANVHGQEVDYDLRSLEGEHRNKFDHPGQPLLSCKWTSKTLSGRCGIDTEGADRLLSETEKHLGPHETSSYDRKRWDPLVYQPQNSALGKWNPLVYRATGELDMSNGLGISEEMNFRNSVHQSPIGRSGEGDQYETAPLVFDELSPSRTHRDGFSIQTFTSKPETQSLWSRQPFEQLFGTTDVAGRTSQFPRLISSTHLVQSSCCSSSFPCCAGVELKVLTDLQRCVIKLLKLDGAEWLFRVDSGADEDLIMAIATVQKWLMETEKSDLCRWSESLGWASHGCSGNSKGCDNLRPCHQEQKAVPNCGQGCVWSGSLLVSFGVWCVHRVLELCLMESRPELWGKYTYVLNRLQGILEPAFAKTRIVPFCRCLNCPILLDHSKSKALSRQGTGEDYCSGDFGRSSHRHQWHLSRNTTSASASIFLDMIKEVETAVGSRKGRTGTTAGDVAFPKGKENLASVLKRYKRRLASKPRGSTVVGSGGRRLSSGFSHALLFAAIVCCISAVVFNQ